MRPEFDFDEMYPTGAIAVVGCLLLPERFAAFDMMNRDNASESRRLYIERRNCNGGRVRFHTRGDETREGLAFRCGIGNPGDMSFRERDASKDHACARACSVVFLLTDVNRLGVGDNVRVTHSYQQFVVVIRLAGGLQHPNLLTFREHASGLGSACNQHHSARDQGYRKWESEQGATQLYPDIPRLEETGIISVCAIRPCLNVPVRTSCCWWLVR